MKLPEGYVEFDGGTVRVVAARLELDEMGALLTGTERDRAAQAPAEAGRGATRRLVLPGGKAVYLRKYLRGGMVRQRPHQAGQGPAHADMARDDLA